ncbi:MAG: hypothetical protein NVS2B15_08780 [Pseudarthrobacter sp.]
MSADALKGTGTALIIRGRECGVHLRSVSDGIDPATSTGRMVMNMLATLAEYERELIIERVNVGIAGARDSGTRFGRPHQPGRHRGNTQSSPKPAHADGPRQTLPLSSDGAARRSTANRPPSAPPETNLN